MFQLVLSDKLRADLAQASATGGNQPVLFDASRRRMANVPGYSKSPSADNVMFFHGREVRKVADAEGGMGFVLQLVSAVGEDQEGWTKEEIAEYDGWGHDSERTWRQGDRLEAEGYQGFRSKFGPAAFTLHHRFYLHLDRANQLWLSAEDGCEGHPSAPIRR